MPAVALITSAAGGIGRHWAGALAARGDAYRPALADVNLAGPQAAFTPGAHRRLHGLDVRDRAQRQAAVEETVAPVMLRQGAGHIVNAASLAGLSPTPGNELHSAAKCGLRAASLAGAVRWRPRGVSVTVVCPEHE